MVVWIMRRNKILKKLNKKYAFGLGLILIVFGAFLFNQLSKNDTPTSTETITYSTDQPDETKPDKDAYEWQGGPKDPKYITLPTINTEGFVQNVGIDQNSQVAVPSNIHVAGWFTDSKSPGEQGLSVIDGHLNGRGANGIFVDLEQLKSGDKYTVELGDGTVKSYEVMEISVVNTKDSVNVLFSQDPKVKSQLNLITCGGNFDQQNRLYDKRVIASSKLID